MVYDLFQCVVMLLYFYCIVVNVIDEEYVFEYSEIVLKIVIIKMFLNF